MTEIADFSQSEVWIVRTTPQERYGAAPELRIANGDVRVSASDRELTGCPAIVRQADGCNFVLSQTGDRRYRCRFFCKPYKQFGPGVRALRPARAHHRPAPGPGRPERRGTWRSDIETTLNSNLRQQPTFRKREAQ